MKIFPYKKLTYQINGLLFETYKKLGFGYQEKYYQRTFEEILKENKLLYKKKCMCQ